ncbi:MAG TPA: hypothetical protein VIR31_00100 [Nitrososphaeraceae archaeon]
MSSPHDTIDEMKELIRQQDDIIRQYQDKVDELNLKVEELKGDNDHLSNMLNAYKSEYN